MPIFNFTVKDTSPLIQYSSNWEMDQGDPFKGRYSGTTFHATQTPGSSATLSFFGTAVTIFGAKRGNHGLYSVGLDGFVSTQANGRADDPGFFQAVLYASPKLMPGPHTITIRNEGKPGEFVDIDYIEVQTGDGINDLRASKEFDDSSNSVTYVPNASWPGPSSDAILTQFYNQTVHVTTVPNAQAVITFSGNAISVFGSTGPSPEFGSYSVKVDKGPAVNFTRNAFLVTNKVLLYQTANLSSGSHTLTLTNVENGRKLDLDYYETTEFSKKVDDNPFSNKSKTPIIAGVAAAIGFILALGIFGIFYWLRRRRQRQQRDAARGSLEGVDKVPDIHVVTPFPATIPPGPSHARQTSASTYQHYSSQSELTYDAPYLAGSKGSSGPSMGVNRHDQPASVSNSRSSRSVDPPSEVAMDDREIGPYPTRRVGSETTKAGLTSPSGSQAFSDSQASAAAVRIPYSPSQLASARMVVRDRPQDWGPVRPEDILPPNYIQATEPMPHAPRPS